MWEYIQIGDCSLWKASLQCTLDVAVVDDWHYGAPHCRFCSQAARRKRGMLRDELPSRLNASMRQGHSTSRLNANVSQGYWTAHAAGANTSARVQNATTSPRSVNESSESCFDVTRRDATRNTGLLLSHRQNVIIIIIDREKQRVSLGCERCE